MIENRKVAVYQWEYRKSPKGEDVLVGITDKHYSSIEELIQDMPETHGKIYGRCWWSKSYRERDEN